MRKNILLAILVCLCSVFCAQAQIILKSGPTYKYYPPRTKEERKLRAEIERATSNSKDNPIANGYEFFERNPDDTYSVIYPTSRDWRIINSLFKKNPDGSYTNVVFPEEEEKVKKERGLAAAKPKSTPIVDGSDIMVQYTFEHCPYLKENMKRTFISEAMLKQVRGTSILENAKWNVNKVLNRLTAILVLNGSNSYNINQVARAVVKHIKDKSLYALLLETQTEDGQVLAFYHSTDKEMVDEMLIFIFGKNTETNIIQITGDLRLYDMGTILRIPK